MPLKRRDECPAGFGLFACSLLCSLFDDYWTQRLYYNNATTTETDDRLDNAASSCSHAAGSVSLERIHIISYHITRMFSILGHFSKMRPSGPQSHSSGAIAIVLCFSSAYVYIEHAKLRSRSVLQKWYAY